MREVKVKMIKLPKREKKHTFIQKNCLWMFMEALFVIASNWVQAKGPAAGEWMMVYDVLMQGSVAHKRVTGMLYRMDLKIIMRGTKHKRVHAVWFPFNKIQKMQANL